MSLRRVFPALVVWVVLFFGAVQARAADAKKPPPPTPIAVVDFQAASGAPTETVLAMAAKVRAYVVELESYTLIDKSNMDAVLNEQKLALKFCSIDDSECLIKVGKQLAVRELVTGRVSQVGDRFFITIEHTDTETARMLHSFTESCRCDAEELVAKADEVAEQFFSGAPRKARVSRERSVRPDVLKITGGSVLLGGGAMTGYFYLQALQARSDYQDASTQLAMDQSHNSIARANDSAKISGGVAGLGALVLLAGFADEWWLAGSGVAFVPGQDRLLVTMVLP